MSRFVSTYLTRETIKGVLKMGKAAVKYGTLLIAGKRICDLKDTYLNENNLNGVTEIDENMVNGIDNKK